MKIRLAVCDDPEIADLDLQDIISVESSTELDLTDSVQAERDHKLHFSLTSKNRYHSSHFLHFREDQEVINWNIRHELMREISKYPFQFEIDSLQISVLKTEAIVPYFDGKEMVMNSKQRADSYQSGTNLRIQAVGPSRVSLEIAYACYSAGQVLKNTKLLRRTTPATTFDKQYRGSRNDIIEAHIIECYIMMNKAIEELGVEVGQELKKSFARRAMRE